MSPGGRPRGEGILAVDALVPNPEHEHEPLPEQILGIALDQRAFGPRQLMAAFAAPDGRFLALTYTERTNPIDSAVEGCLLHFDSLRRGGEVSGAGQVGQVGQVGPVGAAVIFLCDEPVEDGPAPAEFMAKFARAQQLARRHCVHVIDWFACDDERFRSARLRSFNPATEPDWWDVAHSSASS